jgi:hypothetical protein
MNFPPASRTVKILSPPIYNSTSSAPNSSAAIPAAVFAAEASAPVRRIISLPFYVSRCSAIFSSHMIFSQSETSIEISCFSVFNIARFIKNAREGPSPRYQIIKTTSPISRGRPSPDRSSYYSGKRIMINAACSAPR